MASLGSLSPEGIAAAGLSLVGVGALARRLFSSRAVVPPVPPVVPAPVVANNVVPVAGVGVAVVAPVPPVFGPALPPVVTYLMAVACGQALLDNRLTFAFVDFLLDGNVSIRHRIIGPVNFEGPFGTRRGWHLASLYLINRLRREAIGHGKRLRRLTGFSQASYATSAVTRLLEKMFQRITPADTRYVMRSVLLNAGRWAGFLVRKYGIRRGRNGLPYPVYESHHGGNLYRGDVGWPMAYFLAMKGNLLANGASDGQASYVACACMIQLVGVAYGQPPNVEWGVTPEDLGFAAPATLPRY